MLSYMSICYIYMQNLARLFAKTKNSQASLTRPRASMRNTNFKKYAGLFRQPPNVAKRSQRGGLENLSVKRTIKSRNPLKTLTISGLRKLQKLAHLT